MVRLKTRTFPIPSWFLVKVPEACVLTITGTLNCVSPLSGSHDIIELYLYPQTAVKHLSSFSLVTSASIDSTAVAGI